MSKRLFLENLKDGVLHVDFKENKSLFHIDTFIVKDLLAKIRQGFAYGLSEPEINHFFGKGVVCDLLQPELTGEKAKSGYVLSLFPTKQNQTHP
ncbi:hypothetical protein [Trichocoleus sp. FACHB-591]|uniref:hypothetical protein n=1 Tax=Trichocoleus sp. FACHB-591 TaxID=2692872 RepID=UPI001F54EF31|nr:hypothetical protein [Trichocoleus sp. FACHB-591]